MGTRVYRIGRGETNDIVIDDPSISREHAELRRKDGNEFTLADLSSTNGTCVRDGSKWVEIDSATVAGDERVLIGEVVTTVQALLEEAAHRDAVRDANPNAHGRPPREERPSILGIRLPLLARQVRPDIPTSDRRSQLERQAQRLTHTDVAQLVGPYRGRKMALAEASDAAGGAGAAEPAFGGAMLEPTVPVERPEPRLTHLSQGTGEDRPEPSLMAGAPPRDRASPSFAGLPAAPGDADEEVYDSTSIVLDRRGSFRASPPRENWNPPRERTAAGRGFSKWLAIALGLIFLGSAAAAGVVVYTTKGPDKATEKARTGTSVATNGAADAVRVTPSKSAQSQKPAPKAPAAPASKPAAKPAGGNIENVVRKAVIPAVPTRTVPVAALGRAGPTFKPGARHWARTYAGKGRQTFRAIAPAQGGGAFAAGAAVDPATGKTHAWLVRLDSYGNVIWQKMIGSAGDDRALTLLGSRDGGVVAAGATGAKNGGGRHIWIARFDKVGEQRWRRQVPAPRGGRATAVIRAGRGYAVAAIGSTADGPRGMLIRLKSDGDVAWTRTVGASDTWVTGLARLRRGFVLVGAAREKAGGPRTLWVMRTDFKGDKVWERFYPRAGGAASTAYVRRARRRTFIVATTHEVAPGPNMPPTIANARIIRIKRDGDLVWDHLIETPLPDRVSGMVLQKGGVVLAGATLNGQGSGQDLWVARMNVDGKVAWQRRYGGGRQDQAAAMAEGRKGVLFLAGSSSAGKGQGWVLKLDRNGQLAP